MTGPGCGWSKISRVRAPYDNLDPAVKPLQSPESAVYIMDSLLAPRASPTPGSSPTASGIRARKSCRRAPLTFQRGTAAVWSDGRLALRQPPPTWHHTHSLAISITSLGFITLP